MMLTVPAMRRWNHSRKICTPVACAATGETAAPGLANPRDLGPKEATLDLTPWKGQAITLYLANFNRQDRNYNTWTFIEGIKVFDW